MKSLPWSPSEDAILWAHYPTGAAKACLPFLEGRSIKSIRERAARIHCLNRRRSNCVLTREDARLIKLMLEERWRLQRELAQLTTHSIAQKMGVSTSTVESIASGRLWAAA